MRIRAFQSGDRAMWIELLHEGFRVPRSIEQEWALDRSIRRRVVDAGTAIIGCAEWAAPRVRVLVATEQRGAGLATALWAALRVPDGVPLTSAVRDDDATALAFARKRGLEVVEHTESYELDLRGTGTRPSAPEGTTRWEMPERPSEADWRRAYEAFAACCADTPDLRGAVPDEAGWRRLLPANPRGVVLYRAARPAACCFAGVDDPSTWLVLMTGVHPAERRTGLGRAVKSALEGQAAAAGARVLRTNTLQNNGPIRRLNVELGYRRTGGSYRLARP